MPWHNTIQLSKLLAIFMINFQRTVIIWYCTFDFLCFCYILFTKPRHYHQYWSFKKPHSIYSKYCLNKCIINGYFYYKKKCWKKIHEFQFTSFMLCLQIWFFIKIIIEKWLLWGHWLMLLLLYFFSQLNYWICLCCSFFWQK